MPTPWTHYKKIGFLVTCFWYSVTPLKKKKKGKKKQKSYMINFLGGSGFTGQWPALRYLYVNKFEAWETLHNNWIVFCLKSLQQDTYKNFSFPFLNSLVHISFIISLTSIPWYNMFLACTYLLTSFVNCCL